MAKVVTQMKKLSERRVQRPVSAAELQKKTAVLKQRHLAAYRRLHHVKDKLSNRYAELLTEKVQKQRLEMKQHNSAPLKNAGKHNGQSSRGRPFEELVGSTCKDNAAFLKSLPKARYYLILALQRQLAQRDCVKGSREQEHEVFIESGGGEQVSAPLHQGKQVQEQDESELRIPSVCVKPREM
ncbi:hypothetical protein C0J45_2122 [Silurus meridionalis]|nr:hypothetical protein C0J45_2122 [Silurus meridionalis]